MLRVLLWLYLGCPGAVFLAFLLVFFRLLFSVCFIFLPSPSGWFLPWCLFLLVPVVVLCAPGLVLSPPVLPCYIAVPSGCLFSDSFESPVPVATWSPFWPSQFDFGLCLSLFRVACLIWSPFCWSPLCSSVLFASGVLCVSFSPGGFFFLGSLCRSVLLPSLPFLVYPRSCSFRPSWLFRDVILRFLSSVSPSFQFSVLCCSLRLLPSVGGSLSPFLGRSSSLSPCFRLRLLRSVACPDLGLSFVAGSLVGLCPFSFSVRFPSAMRCFFVALLPSVFLSSRSLFPLLLCLSF